MKVGKGNDDEAICAPASGERKPRLLRRAPHPTSAPSTPRKDTVWAFSTVPKRWGARVVSARHDE
jgi:hypothetical protein